MFKQFTRGCIIVTVQPKDFRYSSLLELPNVIATETSKNRLFTDEYGLRVTVVEGTTYSELHAALESSGLESELILFLKECGMGSPKLVPSLTQLKFQLSQPDFKLGELYCSAMKMYAKMNLGVGFSIRMYRTHRKNPLFSTMGIFGRWDCAGETGVFSIEGHRIGDRTFCDCDREQIANELAVQFRQRWPMWPEAQFQVMNYQEIQPLVALSER